MCNGSGGLRGACFFRSYDLLDLSTQSLSGNKTHTHKAPVTKSQQSSKFTVEKQESHCKSAAHDTRQNKTEILVYCAHFSSLHSGSAGNNPLSRRST